MQIAAPASPMRATESQPLTPRQEAAKALVGVPMGVVMTATMTAMSKQMAGETTASRADLLAPLFKQATMEQLSGAMLAAIDGAVALEPALADRSESMKQAAAAVMALVTEAAADTTSMPIAQAMDAIGTPLQAAMTPIMEAALLLDPTLAKQPATA